MIFFTATLAPVSWSLAELETRYDQKSSENALTKKQQLTIRDQKHPFQPVGDRHNWLWFQFSRWPRLITALVCIHSPSCHLKHRSKNWEFNEFGHFQREWSNEMRRTQRKFKTYYFSFAFQALNHYIMADFIFVLSLSLCVYHRNTSLSIAAFHSLDKVHVIYRYFTFYDNQCVKFPT